MKKSPPKTNRYCTICNKMTKYKYDKIVGHSYCLECGRSSMYAKNPLNSKQNSTTDKGGKQVKV